MSIFNAIAQGSNIGAGINAFAQNQYAVNQDRELKAERQQQNAFAMQQNQAETMRQIFMDAVQLGPEAGFDYTAKMAQQYGLPMPDEQYRGILAKASAQGGAAGINAITPSNYDPASIDTFRQSGRYSDLKPIQSEGVVLVAGVPHRRIGGNLYRITDAEDVGEDAATIAGMTTAAQEDAKTGAIVPRAGAESDAADVTQSATATRELRAAYPQLRTVMTDTVSSLASLRDRLAKAPTGPGYGPALAAVSSEMQALNASLTEKALEQIAALADKGVKLTPITEKELAILFDTSALLSNYPQANVEIMNRRLASAQQKLADLEEMYNYVVVQGNDPLNYQGPSRTQKGSSVNVQGVVPAPSGSLDDLVNKYAPK